jgi:hypothetical protein
MACTHRSTCPLVRIFAGKPSLRIWTERYCEGDAARCARVRQASYGERVPASLLPNGQSLDWTTEARA